MRTNLRLLPFRAALLALVLLLAACSRAPDTPPATVAGDVAIEAWPVPALPGSAQPDLFAGPDGRLLLSWLNNQPGRRPAFQFAEHYPDGRWEGPRTIAVGNAMFVNWADTPHIAATADRALWAHWLQKSADAPYAYDIMLVRSLDRGMNWSAQRRVHDDATTTEHGFVSFWPQGDDALGVAWLDGRNTGAVGKNHDAHAGHDGKPADDKPVDDKPVDAKHARGDGGGAMTLRAAVFDATLQSSAETEIDGRVCDCCQTDAVAIGDGALLVYRGRSEGEIRDIHAARFDGETWSKPVRVHADDWKMPACPVNGPAVAAHDGAAVVAWYTAAGDVPAVKLARSGDGGASFAAPVTVDRGAAVQGRVALAFDARQVWLLWLREEAGRQSLWLARYTPDLSKEVQRLELADLQGQGRGTGFPRIALVGDVAYVVWTDVFDGQPQLQGVRIRAAK
jgi:hypothetical protein